MQVHGAPAAVFRCNVSIFIKAGDRAKKREMKKKQKKEEIPSMAFEIIGGSRLGAHASPARLNCVLLLHGLLNFCRGRVI